MDEQALLIKRANELLQHIQYAGHSFIVREGHGGVHLQAHYLEADSTIPGSVPVDQFTRKWLLSPHMTDSEIVFTAFKCCLTSAEHRCREAFRFRGEQIMSPHLEVEDLVAICRQGRAHAGARTRI